MSAPVSPAVALAAVALLVAGLAAALPDRKARLVAKVSAPGYVPHHLVRPMSPDELAFRIVDGDHRLRVVDLRGEAARAARPLPGAAQPSGASPGPAPWAMRHGTAGRIGADVAGARPPLRWRTCGAADAGRR